MTNRHRINSLLLDVSKELKGKLIQATSGKIFCNVDFGVSGHFSDRILDRGVDYNIAISNVRYMTNKLIDSHMCQILYSAERKGTNGVHTQNVALHSVGSRNIAIPFDSWMKDNVDPRYERYLRIRFRTYIIDWFDKNDHNIIYEV